MLKISWGVRYSAVWGRLTWSRDHIECLMMGSMKDLLAEELKFWSSYDGLDSHFRGEMS